MIDALNTKAGMILAGALAVLLLAFGGYVLVVWSGYLGLLVVVNVTALSLLGWWALAVKITRARHAPVVIRDKKDAPARWIEGKLVEHPLYPAGLTSLTTHYDPRITAPQAPAVATSVIDAVPALPRAEPFYRIREQIQPGHLILGYNLAGTIAGDLSDLLSTAIVGRPGTGKTTALRFICAQVLKIGGQPLLLDPHGSIADEVSDILECAEDGSDMERFAARLERELDARLAARRAGQSFGAPTLVLADEWPIISQLAPEAVRVAGRIVLEGRKVGMYALISGQGLPSEQLGGSLVRDALSSRYVFNTTPAQARMAGMDNETAKRLIAQLESAGPGYAILASARRRAEIVAIPQTTTDDLRVFLGGYQMPPLPAKPSLSEAAPILPVEKPLSAQERERERLLAVIRDNPGVSASALCSLAGISNNKVALVRKLVAEAGKIASEEVQ